MTFTIIIFFVSIITAFGMLLFKAWEIKTSSTQTEGVDNKATLPEFPFRHLEKNALYLVKHVLQNLIFIFVKYWFIVITKAKKWISDKWPKINSHFTKKPESNTPYRHSFFQKAILESKTKIKSIKEKVEEEIE